MPIRRAGLAFALLFPAALASSCRSSQTQFPIGIYDVRSKDHLEALRRAGFNWVHDGGGSADPPDAYLKEARRQGITVLATPTETMKRGFAETGVKPHWYVYDEPDVHKVDPSHLKGLIEALKAEWPSAKFGFSLGRGEALKKYPSLGDFVMVDWYPVPHLPLDSVADQLDSAKNAAGGRPVWMILQAFDWRKDPQRDATKPRIGRFPDHREIRFMTYLALVHGADGLFYYTFYDYLSADKTLLSSPERWQAVERVAKEVSSLSPWLGNPASDRLPDIPAPLEHSLWKTGRSDLLIVVNRSSSSAVVPNFLYDRRWRPLFESKRHLDHVFPRDGRGAGYIGPWRVVVLERRRTFMWIQVPRWLVAAISRRAG